MEDFIIKVKDAEGNVYRTIETHRTRIAQWLSAFVSQGYTNYEITENDYFKKLQEHEEKEGK